MRPSIGAPPDWKLLPFRGLFASLQSRAPTRKVLSIMAAVCEICGKHPGFGMKVSFSHKRSPRRWNPNIQRIRIMEGRTPVRRNVCTSCIKANKVRRAV
jgi:large subunit ribosomal protein L28